MDPLESGKTLSEKWYITKLLGEGGMGAVYEASHVRTGKRVAIKLLKAFGSEPDVVARFQREAYISNLVRHPGVVSVLDDGVAPDGSPYLVMDLLEGESLEEISEREGRLEPRFVFELAIEVLGVLDSAHQAGIVHRDLKPSNIFMCHDGQVKVLDFGIAGLQHPNGARVTSQSTGMLGTVGFMPPEQARGEWDLVDARSDLWALCATAFTLLTGRLVHEDVNLHRVFAKAVTEPAPRLRDVDPTVPPAFAGVIDKGLQARPEDRYPDAKSLQAAIQRTLDLVSSERTPAAAGSLDPQTLGFSSSRPQGIDTAQAASRSSTVQRRATTEPVAGGLPQAPLDLQETFPLRKASVEGAQPQTIPKQPDARSISGKSIAGVVAAVSVVAALVGVMVDRSTPQLAPSLSAHVESSASVPTTPFVSSFASVVPTAPAAPPATTPTPPSPPSATPRSAKPGPATSLAKGSAVRAPSATAEVPLTDRPSTTAPSTPVSASAAPTLNPLGRRN